MGRAGKKIIPFEPEHAYEIVGRNLREHDIEISRYPDWKDHVRGWKENGPAYSLVINGEVIGCAGVVMLGKGRGEAWTLLSSFFYRYKKTAYRAICEGLRKIIEEKELWRVQALVRPDFETGEHFIKHLGFEREGLLRGYGPNGEDLIMFARLRPPGG